MIVTQAIQCQHAVSLGSAERGSRRHLSKHSTKLNHDCMSRNLANHQRLAHCNANCLHLSTIFRALGLVWSFADSTGLAPPKAFQSPSWHNTAPPYPAEERSFCNRCSRASNKWIWVTSCYFSKGVKESPAFNTHLATKGWSSVDLGDTGPRRQQPPPPP